MHDVFKCVFYAGLQMLSRLLYMAKCAYHFISLSLENVDNGRAQLVLSLVSMIQGYADSTRHGHTPYTFRIKIS